MPAGFTEKEQEKIREELFLAGIKLIKEHGIENHGGQAYQELRNCKGKLLFILFFQGRVSVCAHAICK